MSSVLTSSVVSDIIAGGSLSILGGALVLLFKRLPREVGQLSRDWRGLPARPGFPAVPGVPERLENVETQFTEVMAHLGRQDATMEEIRHEVTYNSGSSIKDAVHRTDDAVRQLQTDMVVVRTKLGVGDAPTSR